MAKKGKVEDAEASFFGDDLDWLDEEEQEAAAAAAAAATAAAAEAAAAKAAPKPKPQERLPVAPAPTPFVAPAAVGKFGDAEGESKPSRPRRPPMPTLPPTPSMLADLERDSALPTVVDRTEDLPLPVVPTPAKDESLPPDMPTQEDATLEVDPSSEEVAFFEGNLDEQEAVPLVRTHEPPPARGVAAPAAKRRGGKNNLAEPAAFTPPVEPLTRKGVSAPVLPTPPKADFEPEPEPERPEPTAEEEPQGPAMVAVASIAVAAARITPKPAATPAPAPVAQAPIGASRTLDESLPPMNSLPPMPALLERWVPQGDEQEWRDGATALVAEGALVKGVERARLLVEAGRIYQSRLGDRAGAEALFQDALAAGLDDEALRAELAEAAGRAQRWQEMVTHLEVRAQQQGGTAAAETYQRAAAVARQHMDKPEIALDLLGRAVAADPDDYAAWCLLRDALVESGGDEERVRALGRIAELGQGEGGNQRLAADAWWEQGRVLQRLERVSDAKKAFERAREADQGHVPSFLALEALLASIKDDISRAALYESAALRDDTLDGAWWTLKAARLYAAAGQATRADSAYASAVKRGSTIARREQQAWLARNGRHAELAAAIEAEGHEAADEASQALASWRLGQVREQSGDIAGARTAWQEALAYDPAARPAAEAIARVAQASGDPAELLMIAQRRVDGAADDTSRTVAQISLAEMLERQGQGEAARVEWERLAAGSGPALATALGALGRSYRRAGAWEAYAGVCQRQAELARDATEKALHLYRAATAGAPAVEPVAARERLKQAVEASPGFRPAVDAWEAILEEEGDFAGICAALEASGAATSDPARKASVLARAARVAAGRLGDADRARSLAHAAIEAMPGYPAAFAVLSELGLGGGASDEAWQSWRDQAAQSTGSARVWALVGAADIASKLEGHDARTDLVEAQGEDPSHPAPLAGLEMLHLVRDDVAGLLETCRRALMGKVPAARKAELLMRVAELHFELDQPREARSALDELLAVEGPRPVRLASRLAESMQAWELAVGLLGASEAPEDRIHRARLLGQRLQEPRQALVLYRDLFEDPTWAPVAAVGAAGVAQRAGDLPMVVKVHQLLAEGAHAPAMRAAYAAWTAGLLESQGRTAEAARYWRLALDGRPKSEAAFTGARRTMADVGDAEGLRALFAGFRPEDRVGLAEALEEEGDDAAAAAMWRGALDAGAAPMPTLIRLERILARVDDWAGAYDALTKRRELSRDEGTRVSLDAKRRWILAEKLATTDMAWELYRQLHDDQPGDREVTEALARIAGARGETALSIQFLKELAETAPTRDDSARYQRRIAEVYERANDVASARQAYLDALDHVPDDRDALIGLKRLAEQQGDWTGLVAVLQREAGLAKGARRLELRREIARVTQDKLKDLAVAMDAWRSVLDEAAQDEEALSRLLDLAEAQKEWALFVEVGKTLSAQRTGVDRAVLLRRIGVASQVELSREDAVRYFEAAISEDQPDLEAARRLEEINRTRGDWAGSIRCLKVMADHATDVAEKVDLLVRAARMEAEVRKDRVAAGALFDRVLEIDPTNEGALKFLAEHLFSGERNDAALPVYERLEPYMEKTQDVDDFDTRMEMGSFYFRFAELLREAGRSTDAMARYSRALELNPAHLPTLEAVGPLYIQNKQWKDAERVYRQLLQLTGGQGNNDKSATMYADLGVIERALGNGDKAQKRFAKALELFPNHVGGLKGMALLLEDRQDWANLLNIYNNIIYHAVSAEDVIHAYVTKGRVLDAQMGRADKAQQHYDGALAIDGAHPVALVRLAELHTRKGEWKEAKEVADRAATGAAGAALAPLLLVQAGALQASGDSAGAAERVEAACAAAPTLREKLPAGADLAGIQAAIVSVLPIG